MGVPREGRGASTGTQQAANRGACVHTPRVPARKQRPGALAAARALRRPYVGTGSNIKTRPGPPQAGRPVRSHHNRNVAPPGPTPAALNPANQTPRAVPLHRRGPSLATAKGPHHAVREVDTMADSDQNRRFTAAQGAPHSCCDACLRGDSAWIGPVMHNCGASEPASDADPRQNARETARNDEKRRETTAGKRARTTLVVPLDTPSVGRGPLYSASPADCLQRKNIAHEIRSLIGCLLPLARCRLRLRCAAVPPPQVAPKLGSLLTPRP